MGGPWTRQIATLAIDESTDYLIAADLPGNSMAGSQELYNIIQKEGIKNLLYMGVHENMCIMARPFAIEHVRGWGWSIRCATTSPTTGTHSPMVR